MNLAENSNEYITISLSSIVGKFKIVASNDGNLPDFHQHFWKSNQEGILVLSSQDANFKPKSKYIIGVWLEETDAKHIGKFMITYTYSEKHSLLYPGFTFQSALGKQAKAAYRILIPKDVDSLLLLKTPKTDDVKLYLTFDSSKPYPSALSNQFKVNEGTCGIQLVKSDFEAHCKSDAKSPCNLFLVAEGHSKDLRFSLAFNYNGRSITLPDGDPVALPFFNYNAPELTFKFISPGYSKKAMDKIKDTEELKNNIIASVNSRFQQLQV